jgi:imidazolonepropionase-like amidohydrolase
VSVARILQRFGFALVFAALLSSMTWAQAAKPAAYAIKGGKVFTLAGAPIENGIVVIRDGKIVAVGANVEIPADAKVIDATGLEVYPGMFDAVTQIGLGEVSQVSATMDVVELGDYNLNLLRRLR